MSMNRVLDHNCSSTVQFVYPSQILLNNNPLLSVCYASVGGATGHTVVGLCMCVSVCLSAGFLVAR